MSSLKRKLTRKTPEKTKTKHETSFEEMDTSEKPLKAPKIQPKPEKNSIKKKLKKKTPVKNKNKLEASTEEMDTSEKTLKTSKTEPIPAKGKKEGAKKMEEPSKENHEPSRKRKLEKPSERTFKMSKKSVEGKGKTENPEKKAKLDQLTKKARKVERKKSDHSNFSLSLKAKKIWETVRSEKCPADKRELMLNELSNLMNGKAKEFIFAHDTVRVIECLVVLGTEYHRTRLFQELKDQILPLSKSKYAKFFVLKILKYGTKDQKEFIIKKLLGQIVKLIKHSEAANIVECAYNECANANQRSAMMEEFYGPKFALFKDDDMKCLSEILKNKPAEKDQIMKHMKEVLLSLIEKSVVKHSIVHHALREFITHAIDTDRSELIEASREIVVQVLHTKDGSRFAMNCLWHGTPKDRKAIIKSLKTNMKKICEEEEGHLVLLALFDCVDDTKIVDKIVLQEICQNLRDICENVHGRKVVQYLLTPRDPHFFHPDIVGLLKKGDGNKFSKKDAEVRRKELVDASSKMILELIDDRAAEYVASNPHCLLVFAAMKYATGDITKCHKAITKCLSEPYKPQDEDYCHPIEQPSGSILLKKLILLDKENHKQVNDRPFFLSTLIEDLPTNSLLKWINCNRGAFHLILMLETEIELVVEHVKSELVSSKKALQTKNFKGAKILLSKL